MSITQTFTDNKTLMCIYFTKLNEVSFHYIHYQQASMMEGAHSYIINIEIKTLLKENVVTLVYLHIQEITPCSDLHDSYPMTVIMNL